VVIASPGDAPTRAGAARKTITPRPANAITITGNRRASAADPHLTPTRAPTLTPASHKAITVPHANSEPPIAAIASRKSRAWAMTVANPSRKTVALGSVSRCSELTPPLWRNADEKN